MISRRLVVALVVLVLLLAAFGVTYRWTFTPHGRLDYRAAVSLRLLSFERTHRPDPDSDFELTLPVNLIYAISALLPEEAVRRTQDIVIPGGGGELRARVYWPDAPSDDDASPIPVIVYYHGGGFVVGSVEIFDPLARSLSNAASAIVVSVDYRLAPAHPYPAALEDCYAALEWVAQHAPEIGADASRIVVGGDSAGGNLAAVVALKARDEGGPAIAGQLLYYPVTDQTATPYASAQHFADGYGLSKEASAAFRRAYVGHLEDRSDPYISPLLAPRLDDLPPALVVTGGFDPLTDAAKAYVERLRQSGVRVAHSHYPGMIHGFMSIRPFSQRRAALIATSEFLGELFGR